MKFQEFVEAHFEWRNDLIKEIKSGITEQMIADTHEDDLCAIGHWFHGQGEQLFPDMPEFIDAKEAHAEFHHAAGLSLKSDGILKANEEFHRMLKAFKVLNNKIGHLD